MLIRLAAKTGTFPILQAGKYGVLDARDGHVGQEDFGQEKEGNQLGHMTRTLFAPSPFFCPKSSCPTPTLRLLVTQPDKHGSSSVTMTHPRQSRCKFLCQKRSAVTSNDSLGASNDNSGASNDSLGVSSDSTGCSNDSLGASSGSAGSSNDSLPASSGSAGSSNDNTWASNSSAGSSTHSLRTSSGSAVASNDFGGPLNRSGWLADGLAAPFPRWTRASHSIGAPRNALRATIPLPASPLTP